MFFVIGCNDNSGDVTYWIQEGNADPGVTPGRYTNWYKNVKEISAPNDSAAFIQGAKWFIDKENKPDDFNVKKSSKYGMLSLTEELPEKFVEDVMKYAHSEGEHSTPIIDSILEDIYIRKKK